MHEIASRERLQPSLLDRLTDAAPEQTRETFEQQTLGMQQLRQAVLRDLAWLLNTTNLAATEDLSAYAAGGEVHDQLRRSWLRRTGRHQRSHRLALRRHRRGDPGL